MSTPKLKPIKLQIYILTPEELAKFSFRRDGDLCRFFAAARVATFLAGDSSPAVLLKNCPVLSVDIARIKASCSVKWNRHRYLETFKDKILGT